MHAIDCIEGPWCHVSRVSCRRLMLWVGLGAARCGVVKEVVIPRAFLVSSSLVELT